MSRLTASSSRRSQNALPRRPVARSESSTALAGFPLGSNSCSRGPRAAVRSPSPRALSGGARMRKFPLVLALTTLIATPVLAQQREDGVWHVRGDNGEIVHVLPDQASAEAFEHRFGIAPPPIQMN